MWFGNFKSTKSSLSSQENLTKAAEPEDISWEQHSESGQWTIDNSQEVKGRTETIMTKWL